MTKPTPLGNHHFKKGKCQSCGRKPSETKTAICTVITKEEVAAFRNRGQDNY